MLAIITVCALLGLTYAGGNIHVTVHITQPQDQPKIERISVVWKELSGTDEGASSKNVTGSNVIEATIKTKEDKKYAIGVHKGSGTLEQMISNASWVKENGNQLSFSGAGTTQVHLQYDGKSNQVSKKEQQEQH
ncbi:hypothetical protein Ddc_23969 [Ditylenchus destructor]|nr:hypothetical protein Ddc_23969 [Ditylenchus destructor]